MQDLSAAFTQPAIDALKSSLRPFDQSLGAINADDANVAAYLYFYQLPEPNRDLDVFVGRIEVNQTSIFSLAWQPAVSRGTAIVVHGYTDHTGLFNHLIQELLDRQLTVVCFDLQGHGLSSGDYGDIADFADYVTVLESVMAIATEKFPGPQHAVGQSMGGAVLLKYLIKTGNSSPFASINLLAPLLQPSGWAFKRWLYRLTHKFRRSLKRVFRPSSLDKRFLDFVRFTDPLQQTELPVTWVGALDQWVQEFKGAKGCPQRVNLIQGCADKTLDWQVNLRVFKQKIPALQVHLIDCANHHLVNEIKPLRDKIFAALEL